MANELPEDTEPYVFGCDDAEFPHLYGGKMSARGLRVGGLLVYRGNGELVDIESGRVAYFDNWWVVELRFGNTYTFATLQIALRFADAAMIRHGSLIELGDEWPMATALGLLENQLNGK